MTEQQISKLSEIRKQLNQIDHMFNTALVLTFEIEEAMIDLREEVKQYEWEALTWA